MDLQDGEFMFTAEFFAAREPVKYTQDNGSTALSYSILLALNESVPRFTVTDELHARFKKLPRGQRLEVLGRISDSQGKARMTVVDFREAEQLAPAKAA